MVLIFPIDFVMKLTPPWNIEIDFWNTCRKVPKFWNARNLCLNLPKIQEKRTNSGSFRKKDANGIANSEDPDQTAHLGAVWSGSALFPQTCLFENLGSLRYCNNGMFSDKQLLANSANQDLTPKAVVWSGSTICTASSASFKNINLYKSLVWILVFCALIFRNFKVNGYVTATCKFWFALIKNS